MALKTLRERLTLIAMPAQVRWDAFASAVAAGLGQIPKQLPCCYFYDQEGSLLFEDICTQPEYYLTRAESEILLARASDIAARCATHTELVELGSGSAAKTRLLIEAFLRRQGTLRYVPVDICRTILEESSLDLLRAYPSLEILAVAGEYQEGLRYLSRDLTGPKLILWLGSNIGNLERSEAAVFLRRVRETLTTGDLMLLGIDLRKDRHVLEPAYDDARGVTAQFNRNILARINRDLGGHFNLEKFRHRAFYNEEAGRVEMHLVSAEAQQVAIDRLKLVVDLGALESIQTENSYKYSLAEIEALARAAGLVVVEQWFDQGKQFSVNLLAPAKG